MWFRLLRVKHKFLRHFGGVEFFAIRLFLYIDLRDMFVNLGEQRIIVTHFWNHLLSVHELLENLVLAFFVLEIFKGEVLGEGWHLPKVFFNGI